MRTLLEPSSSSSSVVGRDIYSSAKERAPSCDDALSSFFPDKKRAMHIKTTTTTTTGDGWSMHHRFDRRCPGIQTGGTRRRRWGRVRRQAEVPGTLLFGYACLPALSDVPPGMPVLEARRSIPSFWPFDVPPAVPTLEAR